MWEKSRVCKLNYNRGNLGSPLNADTLNMSSSHVSWFTFNLLKDTRDSHKPEIRYLPQRRPPTLLVGSMTRNCSTTSFHFLRLSFIGMNVREKNEKKRNMSNGKRRVCLRKRISRQSDRPKCDISWIGPQERKATADDSLSHSCEERKKEGKKEESLSRKSIEALKQ